MQPSSSRSRVITTSPAAAQAPPPAAPTSQTQIVLLGTDRSIVISGDTNPTQATIDACHGCDVLIHEVHTLGWLAKRPDFQAYAARYHTTTAQLAELASQAKPRLLILYHASIALRPAVNPRASSPGELLSEMATRYSGPVVVGRDLDVY